MRGLPHKVLRKLCKVVRRLHVLLAEFYLSLLKRSQKDLFLLLQSRFSSIHAELSQEDISDFITPPWSRNSRMIEEICLPRPLFSFLRSDVIRNTMFGTARVPAELKFLEGRLSEQELKRLLQEDYVGKPAIMIPKYLTSSASVHHLYHLIYLESKTGLRLHDVTSIVEWGGGYGNMAKIVKRINSDVTYIIIDIPPFCCIQWLYLCTTTGATNVNILMNSGQEIEVGKINLLPVCFLREKNLCCSPDIFVATWSLSESSRLAQDYVESANFFNARHILLAFQKSDDRFPNAYRLHDIAMRRGMSVESIGPRPGNFYAFC